MKKITKNARGDKSSSLIHFFDLDMNNLDGTLSQVLHFTDHDIFVTYNSIEYTPLSITFDKLVEDLSMTADNISLKVDNVNSELSNLALNSEWRNNKILITRVLYKNPAEVVDGDIYSYGIGDALIGTPEHCSFNNGMLNKADCESAGIDYLWIPAYGSNPAYCSYDKNVNKESYCNSRGSDYVWIPETDGVPAYCSYNGGATTEAACTSRGYDWVYARGNIPAHCSYDGGITDESVCKSKRLEGFSWIPVHTGVLTPFCASSNETTDEKACENAGRAYTWIPAHGGSPEHCSYNKGIINEADCTNAGDRYNWLELSDEYPKLDLDSISEKDEYLMFGGIVDSFSASEAAIDLTLTTKFANWDKLFPTRTFNQNEFTSIVDTIRKRLFWGSRGKL